MIYNISFDICAIVISFFSLFIMISKKDLHKESNKLLLVIVVAILVASIFDIWSSVGNSYVDQYSDHYRDFLNMVFLFVYVSTACLFAWYMITLLGLNRRIKKSLLIVFFLPEVFIILLLASNPIFRWVFYYDASGIYLHGTMMYVLYGTGYLYMLFTVVLTIRCRKLLLRPQRYAAIILLILSIVPIFVQQFFMPYQLIELFFQSIGIFGFITTVENFDSIHNPITKAYNRAAFLREIDLSIKNKTVFDAIIVKLSRSSYFDVAAVDASYTNGFLASVVEWLMHISKKIDVYDCERGHFILLIYRDSGHSLQAFVEKITQRFSDKWIYQNKAIQFPIQLCLVNVPTDVQTSERMVHLVDFPYINDGINPTIISAKELEAAWQEQTGDLPKEYQFAEEVLCMLDDFVSRVSTLTPAEYNILQYYVNGNEITEIPELAFVSIHTVRKHNKSIYKKLAVATKEELLIYVDLLRRSDRLSELERADIPL